MTAPGPFSASFHSKYCNPAVDVHTTLTLPAMANYLFVLDIKKRNELAADKMQLFKNSKLFVQSRRGADVCLVSGTSAAHVCVGGTYLRG